MIDVKKALSQRCYIIFDSNEQLRKFFKDNKIEPYIGFGRCDKIISVHDSGEFITLGEGALNYQDLWNCPRYHHSQLTITDDGE